MTARMSVVMQLDAQATNRDIELSCGVRAIAAAAHERIENMLPLNLG